MSVRDDSGTVPITDGDFDEERYLAANPDVAKAVLEGRIRSGRIHYERFGRGEGRRMARDAVRKPARGTERAGPGQGPSESLSFLARAKGYLNRLSGAPARLNALEERLRDNEILVEQLLTILARETGVAPPPPKHLQVRVTGAYSAEFIETGFSGIVPSLNRALKSAGKQLRDFSTILDFGCGCGRASRAIATLCAASELHGTDIDPEAISWLQRNFASYGEFVVTPHHPPTPYQDAFFGFVFGISVFTHLPEEMQFEWLGELARVLKPGGYAVLTTHGAGFHNSLDATASEQLKRHGFYYGQFGSNYGRSISLPDFYQTAFHSHDYIRSRWNEFLEVLEIEPLGFENFQDSILLRRRC